MSAQAESFAIWHCAGNREPAATARGHPGDDRGGQPPVSAWICAGKMNPHTARVANRHGADFQQLWPEGVELDADGLGAVHAPTPEFVDGDMGKPGEE